ncbi:uncharacterized protein LOC102806407 [Saccoglossus kowalevskii]|uniref:Uncharacterized protein LOC102806407 n=1 Tax=Saccoglossus kowalevskii TaxID=10224 RepID=A0ABM0M9X2_SACKO|nr:PREDICTED: uncharacterized protein LOC102806407 [Saccoglossus kowalevskii]
MSRMIKLALMVMIVAVFACSITSGRRRMSSYQRRCQRGCYCNMDELACVKRMKKSAPNIQPTFIKLRVLRCTPEAAKTILEHAPFIQELEIVSTSKYRFSYLPIDFFESMLSLQTLEIPTMTNKQLPNNFMPAIERIPNLVDLDIGGNEIACNCDYLHYAQERGIYFHMTSTFTGCLEYGFALDEYDLDTFSDICGYTIVKDAEAVPEDSF